MKTKTIVLIMFVTTQILIGQTERYLVEKTLYDYIEGSSYNKTDILKRAFTKDATLYLNTKNGFSVLTPKNYISFFKDRVYGQFNGRIGTILSVEIENDIATAKVEILIPKMKWHFIDLFLLKKINNQWKIISKTATKYDNSIKNGGKILFIVSNAHFYGNSTIKTGNSFYEIVNAYDTFIKAGFHVDFVSPEGGAIPIGYINTSLELQKKYLYDYDLMYALKHTMSPDQVDPSQYKAVQYIGGGSAMFGVPENKQIQNIVMAIYEKHKGVISSVCHGTAGIVHLKTSDGKYLVKGKRVNGYPDDYEKTDMPYFKTFPFLIKETIEKRGGDFRFSEPNTPHVEVDGRLVTGQNYLSSIPVSLKVIELILESVKD